MTRRRCLLRGGRGLLGKLALALLVFFACPGSVRAEDPADFFVRLSVGKVIAVNDDLSDGGSGTGFIVAPGWVVTNAHVMTRETGTPWEHHVFVLGVPGAARALQTELVDVSYAWDLALLRINEDSDPALVIADPLPSVGSTVVAYGYPGLLQISSVTPDLEQINRTSGEVTKIEDTVWGWVQEGVSEIVYHSATLSSGNSGGPLVNPCGQVVGINTVVFGHVSMPGEFDAASSSENLIAFLRENDVPFELVSSPCRVAGAGIFSSDYVQAGQWVVIALVALLATWALIMVYRNPKPVADAVSRIISPSFRARTQLERREPAAGGYGVAASGPRWRLQGAGWQVELSGAELEAGVVLGADPRLVDQVIAGAGVGARHLRVRLVGGQVLAEDLGSGGVSRIDGEALAPFQPSPVEGRSFTVGQESLSLIRDS